MTRRLKVTLLRSLAVLSIGVGLVGAAPALAATTDTSSSSDSSSSSSSAVTSDSTTATAEFDMSPNAAISLDSAPDIGFGANIAPNSKSNGSYTASTLSAPLEVSNPGLSSGWTVQLKNTPFTDADGDTLGGAQLTLGTADVAAGNSGNPSTAPTQDSAPLTGSGDNQVVFSAPAKGGLGIWDSSYAMDNVNLTVPSGQLPGTYTSTLTWQLSDTPQ
ncbi:MAG: WxL domain-containing protein [Levilactobacillus sp.]|uniref:WxL domain-containing protein n=1 Tax=Levilactobacillus sp. TaxID=2767919 RepID=UPI00258A648A|nr:WxL domain-containing protein [Levilactobacillus sp.]MCI1553511.1 WxL domain-containing protein [Levilactobacillus sp.]